MRLRVLLAFALSGAAGLMFEVMWARQLGNVLGNTVHSAAVVTGVFVLGLGLGAAWAGPFADRLTGVERLVRAYAALELFVAGWGLLLAFALPALASVSLGAGGYQVEPSSGWFVTTASTHALRVLLSAMLLFPPALAMGATLVVLMRALARSDDPITIGVVYCANTLGASLGAIAVDVWGVPAFGLFGAQACASGLDLTAALLALRALKGHGASSPAAAAPAQVDGARLPRSLVLAVFLAGVAGLALEIVWFRYLSSLFGAHRSTLALVLGVVLIGIWVGSALSTMIAARTRQPIVVLAAVQCALVVLASLGIAVPFARAAGAGWIQMLPGVLCVAGLPSLALGSAFPLACAAARSAELGRSAGRLYLANAAGSLCGSLGAGFVLIPAFGTTRAFAIAASVSLLSALCVLRPGWSAGAWPRRVLVVSVALAVVSLAWRFAAPEQQLLRRIYARSDVEKDAILFAEDVDGSIAITERRDAKGRAEDRVLYVDGALMSGTLSGPQRYMRAFVHVPLLQLDAPERALVICFGVGITAHAASLHPSIQHVEIADLSRQVLSHGGMFSRWNGDVLRDPRTKVYVNDGRQHLRMQPDQSYDLITLEPPPLMQAGVGALYAREFYALARAKLKPGGFMTQWLPAYQVTSDAADSMVRAFIDVFPNAVLLDGWENHLILMGRNAPEQQLDPVALKRRLASRSAVLADLDGVSLGSTRAIAATFAADGITLDAATAGVPASTDNWPAGELAATLRRPSGSRINAAWFDVSGISRWCPACLGSDGGDGAGLEGLAADLRDAQRRYESDAFRAAR